MIALFAPARQNEPFLNDIQAAMAEIVRSGHYILGPAVGELEEALVETLGYQHAVACSSGTEALTLSLKALELPEGAKVLTPAFSFVASSNSIAWSGFHPVFADVDPATANISLETLQAAWTDDIKAVMAVDLYGRQAPIKEIREFCQSKGVPILEDGAQSIGVPNSGAQLFTTSFYPTKNLGCLGDAGAVMTDDPTLAERLKRLATQGAVYRDRYDWVGTNARMDTLQAAVLKLKLPKLHEWNSRRQEIAKTYLNELQGFEEHISLPPDEGANIWSLFTIRVPKNRNTIKDQMSELGVGCGTYYSQSLAIQKAFEKYEPNRCPNAERLADEVLSLPLYPELTEREIGVVVESLKKCLRSI